MARWCQWVHLYAYAYVLLTQFTSISCALTTSQTCDEDPAVTRFREYLRIESVYPNPDYASCITWLYRQAAEIGLEFHIKWFESPNVFAVWLTWNGTDPTLKSILVNSHMDVVPADTTKWTHPPFDAYKDENGTIYARGAQDMKGATVAQLEAVRRLMASGFRPLRSIHISVLPGEETGGLGMQAWVNSTEFAQLNVGLDIEEGGTTATEEMGIIYGEKSVWQVNFTVTGTAAHASTLPNNTAGEKLSIVIDKMLEFRASQIALLTQPNVTMSDVTSLNLVRVGGGISDNTIPGELWASFDMRIRIKPSWNFSDVENMLNGIAEEAGPGVSICYIQKSLISAETPVDNTNVWWVTIQEACQQMNVTCPPRISNAVSDGRFARNIGIPTFGIGPFFHTVLLAHQDNERINEREFLAAIDRYAAIVKNVASVSATARP